MDLVDLGVSLLGVSADGVACLAAWFWDQMDGTKVCRHNWHGAGSLGLLFPLLKYRYIFQIKYTEKQFFSEQHSETVTAWNYQNADCSLKNTFVALFIIIFRALSFPCWRCVSERLSVRTCSASDVKDESGYLARRFMWYWVLSRSSSYINITSCCSTAFLQITLSLSTLGQDGLNEWISRSVLRRVSSKVCKLGLLQVDSIGLL